MKTHTGKLGKKAERHSTMVWCRQEVKWRNDPQRGIMLLNNGLISISFWLPKVILDEDQQHGNPGEDCLRSRGKEHGTD